MVGGGRWAKLLALVVVFVVDGLPSSPTSLLLLVLFPCYCCCSCFVVVVSCIVVSSIAFLVLFSGIVIVFCHCYFLLIMLSLFSYIAFASFVRWLLAFSATTVNLVDSSF